MLKLYTRVELFIALVVVLALAVLWHVDPPTASTVVVAAHFVWKDPFVSINGVDLSDHVKQATLNYNAEMVDDTCGGDNTRNRLGGIKDWSLSVEFAQDYAASEVDASMFSIVGTSVAVIVRPTTSAVGATNPNYTGNAVLENYQPFGGQIGAQAMAPVTLQGNGDLSRATA